MRIPLFPLGDDRRYFSQISVLQEEVADRERLLKMAGEDAEEILSCITRQEEDGTWITTVHEYAYEEFRKSFWLLVDRIRRANVDRFASKEEVFRLFDPESPVLWKLSKSRQI